MSFTPARVGRSRDLWLAVVARAVSLLGDEAAVIALTLRLHDSGRGAGAIAALFSLGGIVSPLILGYFIDRHGATRVLAANYVAAGVSIILIGLWSGDATLAAIGVFCAGLFVIGGQGGINALAAMLYPTEMRATGVGWALGAGRVASVFGPLSGGACWRASGQPPPSSRRSPCRSSSPRLPPSVSASRAMPTPHRRTGTPWPKAGPSSKTN